MDKATIQKGNIPSNECGPPPPPNTELIKKQKQLERLGGVIHYTKTEPCKYYYEYTDKDGQRKTAWNIGVAIKKSKKYHQDIETPNISATKDIDINN